MYKIILPFRYLFRRRISTLAVFAVALSVFIVVVVMTVMTGLVESFRDKNHKFVGDCIISTDSLVGFAGYDDFLNILDQQDFIKAASPVIKTYGLLTPLNSNRDIGIELMGIDPKRHTKVTAFGETLYYHRAEPEKAFAPTYDPNLAGCVAGINMMVERKSDGSYDLSETAVKMGFAISSFPLTPKGAPAKGGAGLLNTKTFYYSDVSHTGLALPDSSTIYLSFKDAQALSGMDTIPLRASAIYIKFAPDTDLQASCDKTAALWKDFIAAKKTEKLAYLFDNVKVQSWKSYRRASIAIMEKEHTMMTVLFALMGITTVFIILVVFYMLVTHKSKDIGIMKSVGISNSNVRKVFLNFALLIGVIGSFIGTTAGIVFLRYINEFEDWLFARFGFQLWDRTVYTIDDIPNQLNAEVLLVIIASAITASVIGAMLPSIQISRRSLIDTLQVTQI